MGVPDEYDTAQRTHATNATAAALETSSDGARARSEGSLEPKTKAPCNEFEILRLKNDIVPHPNNEQLGFYLLALCSHIVFKASKPQFEPQNLKFVAREAARRDKGASMTGPEPPGAAGRGKKAQGRDDARSRSEVRRRKTQERGKETQDRDDARHSDTLDASAQESMA